MSVDVDLSGLVMELLPDDLALLAPDRTWRTMATWGTADHPPMAQNLGVLLLDDDLDCATAAGVWHDWDTLDDQGCLRDVVICCTCGANRQRCT